MLILLVDDNPDIRGVYALGFEVAGHETRLARNGAEAVAAVRREQFDAIVIDIEMPGLDGLEAISVIRASPHGSSVPILVFTAYGDDQNWLAAQRAGADALLSKPITPAELVARVQSLVEPS